jgi:hypothetical protein
MLPSLVNAQCLVGFMKDLADITRVSAAQPVFTLQVNPRKQPAIIYEVLLSSQSMFRHRYLICLHSENLQYENGISLKTTVKSTDIVKFVNYFCVLVTLKAERNR